METDPTLLEIIDLCYKFDKTARQFYLDLSEGTKDRDLKEFWRQMSFMKRPIAVTGKNF